VTAATRSAGVIASQQRHCPDAGAIAPLAITRQ